MNKNRAIWILTEIIDYFFKALAIVLMIACVALAFLLIYLLHIELVKNGANQFFYWLGMCGMTFVSFYFLFPWWIFQEPMSDELREKYNRL